MFNGHPQRYKTSVALLAWVLPRVTHLARSLSMLWFPARLTTMAPGLGSELTNTTSPSRVHNCCRRNSLNVPNMTCVWVT